MSGVGGVPGVSLGSDPPRPPGDPQEQLVRHFLIETGPRGVRIRGCPEEPYFGEGGSGGIGGVSEGLGGWGGCRSQWEGLGGSLGSQGELGVA